MTTFFFFFFPNKTINRNCKIVISGWGVKGWELVSQRTWVDPHLRECSHAWAGGGGEGGVVHCITQKQHRCFIQISIFWAKWGKRSLAVFWQVCGEHDWATVLQERLMHTTGLPAGHRGAGLSAVPSALRHLIPTSSHGLAFGHP